MKWTQVPAGHINAANQRLWTAIGDSAEEVANLINRDPVFVANIARLMINGGCEYSTSQKLAREIMGKNFFGMEEAQKYLSVRFSKQQLVYMAEIPFSEEVLRECKDKYVLVATSQMSILDILGIVNNRRDQIISSLDHGLDNQTFVRNKGGFGWQLVLKELIVKSTYKSFDDQQALLSKDEMMPTARVMIYTVIGHYLASGECLFENTSVRCLELDWCGRRACVEFFLASKRFFIKSYYDDYLDNNLGISAVKEPLVIS